MNKIDHRRRHRRERHSQAREVDLRDQTLGADDAVARVGDGGREKTPGQESGEDEDG